MFTNPPELSSDLEWMLQSGQATRPMLAEALVAEYSVRVFTVALALFEEPVLARRATVEAFAAALVNLYRYRSGSDTSTWFYQSALVPLRQMYTGFSRAPDDPAVEPARLLDPQTDIEAEIWGILDSLGRTERTGLVLADTLNLPLRDIAYLLHRRESEVSADIRAARQTLQNGLYRAGEATLDSAAWVDGWLRRRWSNLNTDLSDVDLLVGDIVRLAELRDIHRKRLTTFQEIILVGAVILLVVAGIRVTSAFIPAPVSNLPQPTSLTVQTGQGSSAAENTGVFTDTLVDDGSIMYWATEGETLASIAAKLGESVDLLVRMNRLLPDEKLDTGQGILVMVGYPASVSIPSYPLNQDRSLPKLSVNSSSEAIRQRILSSEDTWQSLWANIEIYDYGPASSVGPPWDHHSQVWISKPDKGLEVEGPTNDEPPDDVFLDIAGLRYSYAPNNEPRSITASSSLIRQGELHDLLYPDQTKWIREDGSFEIIGAGIQADRDALIVDWKNAQGKRELRLWVDEQTGIILQLLRFGGAEGLTILENATITDIIYDVNFSPTFFDPRSASKVGYILNTPVPSRLDHAILLDTGSQPTLTVRSGTTTVMPGTPTPAPNVDPAYNPLGNAAGHSYTMASGNPVIFDPTSILCDRSPDGKRIAFVNLPSNHLVFDSERSFYQLQWYNQNHPNVIFSPPWVGQVYDFAFSPDGRHLALFGNIQRASGRVSGIFILDLDTGGIWEALNVDYANSLVWSPDGNSLAFIGGVGTQLVVINVQSGRVIYRSPFDWDNPANLSDSPVRGWQVNFPVKRSGASRCMLAANH